VGREATHTAKLLTFPRSRKFRVYVAEFSWEINMSNYLLQMFYDIGGEECSNRFFYSSESLGNDAATLGLAFVANVLPEIGACLSSVFSSQVFRIRNVDDDTDFTEFATTETGLRASVIESPWAAWGFQLLPTSYLVRKGAKRFAGVADVDVTDSLPVSGVQDELDALAVALGTSIASGGVTYVPVIFSPPNQSHPGTLYNEVGSAIFKRYTTQNSRKPW